VIAELAGKEWTPERIMLRQTGVNVRFAVEPGQEHSLETLAGSCSARLFDQMEEAARKKRADSQAH
jgi:hypothetical protein